MELEGRVEAYFRDIDDKVAEALGRLAASGRIPPCGPGCHWCCYLPVRASAPEAALIAAYLGSSLTRDGRLELKKRLEAWLGWQREELPRHITGADVSKAYLLHGPPCPFLNGGLCDIYPVRPMGCRVHFSYRLNQMRARCARSLHIRPASHSPGCPRRRQAVMPEIPDGPSGRRYRLRGFPEAAAGTRPFAHLLTR